MSLILDSLLHKRSVQRRTFWVKGILLLSNLVLVIGLISLKTRIMRGMPTGLRGPLLSVLANLNWASIKSTARLQMSRTFLMSPLVAATFVAHRLIALSSMIGWLSLDSVTDRSLSLTILIMSSFEYGVKLTIFGLHSGFNSRRGNMRSVKSNELAIPTNQNF